MNDAGLALDSILDTLKTALTDVEKQVLQRISQRVRKGSALHRAMEIERLPQLDVALIKVGESTGTLSDIAKFLTRYYEERATLEKSVRRAMIRPFLLFLSSLFLRDLPSLVGGLITPAGYLLRTFGLLFVVISLAAMFVHVYGLSYRSRAVAERLQAFLARLPWFGSAVRALNKERYFTCLRLGLKSGADLPTMLEIAKETSVLPSVRHAAGVVAQTSQRTGFAPAFAQSGMCTSDELLILRSGESAGQIEEALEKISQALRDELQHRLKTFEAWLPKVIYFIAMLYIASGIVSSTRQRLELIEKQIDQQVGP